MKKWNAPEIKELDVKMTASGGDKSTSEQNGGFTGGSWHNATYDSTNYEKCEGQGSVYKKHEVKS